MVRAVLKKYRALSHSLAIAGPTTKKPSLDPMDLKTYRLIFNITSALKLVSVLH